jgi:transposase, IS6 family
LSLFKRRRFPVEIILLCVRWYCKSGISYRDLADGQLDMEHPRQ